MADPEKPFFPAEAAAGPRPRPRLAAPATPEAKFWRSFRNTELSPTPSNHAVTHLDFSPAFPHDLAASSSASVVLFRGGDLSPKPFSPITHFSDIAYSPSFRPLDGSLLAAGDHSGLVLLFDPNKSRPPLRRLLAHSRPTRVVRFLSRSHLFSAGDDATIHLWDIASASSTPSLSIPSAHKDYIRAGAPSPASTDVLASGSYDHHVKLWDVRAGPDPVVSFSHGAPVECLLFLPSGGSIVATAGGNSVKLWDAVGGFRLLHSMESHNKTVTSLCLTTVPNQTDGTRILSVSIDGYMKVFNFSDFKVTHSTRYPSMLLSVASSPTGLVRAIGTSNGVIYAGRRKKKGNDDAIGSDMLDVAVTKQVLRPTNYRYFLRGQSEKPREGDYVVEKPAKLKLAEHDKLLKKFRHKDALVSALSKRNPNTIVAVLDELVLRKKLMRCIGNLDESELGMLLAFLHKYATMPTRARFLMGLAKKVIQMRFEDIQKSKELKVHVRNLKWMVAQEIKIQISLQELKGMLSPLLRLAAR